MADSIDNILNGKLQCGFKNDLIKNLATWTNTAIK